MSNWPVVPLSEKQLKDVNPEDILENGLYRKCNIYKGGGGYDQFCSIYKNIFGVDLNPVQFVVQLYGCPLRCPYCYVTEDGIFGTPTYISTKELIKSYEKSGLDVFHLMGGAPAIYLSTWPEIQDKVKVFHSDFLLIERKYPKVVLKKLKGLHAVSLKEKYLYTNNQIELLWKNLESLIKYKVNFYITFTGKDEFSEEIKAKFGPEVLKNSFVIPIIKYKALEK
jgi:hypothetical protein